MAILGCRSLKFVSIRAATYPGGMANQEVSDFPIGGRSASALTCIKGEEGSFG